MRKGLSFPFRPRQSFLFAESTTNHESRKKAQNLNYTVFLCFCWFLEESALIYLYRHEKEKHGCLLSYTHALRLCFLGIMGVVSPPPAIMRRKEESYLHLNRRRCTQRKGKSSIIIVIAENNSAMQQQTQTLCIVHSSIIRNVHSQL